jgi:hypothetical protein
VPYDWSVTDISAFQTGPWMAKLNDFAGKLILADRRSHQDIEFGFFGEKAKGIAIV